MNEYESQIDKIYGAWRLVSLDAIKPNGEITTGWLGPKPTGLLVYDRNGYMSVQIMSGPRDSAGQTQDKFGSYLGYYAYFGTFEINEETQIIIHRVRGSMRSDEIGLQYEQNFTLAADELILLTPNHLVNGEERRNRIIWERVKEG